MMTLDFGGYGAEYCIGSLSDREVNNIRVLLERFDQDVIFDKYDLALDNDYKENFYEYDDVYRAWSVCGDFTISVREDDYQNLDIEDYQTEFKSIQYPKGTGWYVCSCSSEKGHFFSVVLPIEKEDFDETKLKIIYDDLSLTWLSDIVISGIEYDGEDLELDFDSADTNGKGFYQKLVHFDESGDEYDGMELLTDEIDPPKYNTLDDVEDTVPTIYDYITINDGKLEDVLESHIVYHSPLLYDKFPKEVVDERWFKKDEIRAALNLGLIDEIPKHIMKRVEQEAPEWLI